MKMEPSASNPERPAWRWLLWIPVVGIVQFFICFVVSANYYPGGGPLHLELTDGFRFWENPISDLGRYIAWNGEPNQASNLIYTPSLTILTISIVPLCVFLVDLTKGIGPVLLGATFFLAISVGLMTGVAMTPYDIYFADHDFLFTSCLLYSSPSWS